MSESMALVRRAFRGFMAAASSCTLAMACSGGSDGGMGQVSGDAGYSGTSAVSPSGGAAASGSSASGATSPGGSSGAFGAGGAGAGGTTTNLGGFSNIAGSTSSSGATGAGAGAADNGGAGGSIAGQAGNGSGGASGGASQGCVGKSYKLCEDFEASTVGAVPTGWTIYQGYGGGSAQDETVASDQSRSGSKALKSISAARGARRIQRKIDELGPTASKHWGRVFYKVAAPAPSIDGYLHVTFVSLKGVGENRVVDTVEAPNTNKHQWLYNNPDDHGGVSSLYDWTFDAQWHCAEWYVDVGTKSYRFFSDSAEVKDLAFTGKANAEMSDYTTIILGATYYQAPIVKPAFTVWFDDLAIDDHQIGCK